MLANKGNWNQAVSRQKEQFYYYEANAPAILQKGISLRCAVIVFSFCKIVVE